MPAKAGIQSLALELGPRLRGDERREFDSQSVKRHRPCSLRRRVRRRLFLPLDQIEGMARQAAQPFLTVTHRLRCVAPLGAPSQLFCPRDRASGRGREGSCPPRSGQLSPPFVRAASSHRRQSPIVGTDGYPRPPGSEVTSLARGRRILLHLQDASDRRPQTNRTRPYKCARTSEDKFSVEFRNRVAPAPQGASRCVLFRRVFDVVIRQHAQRGALDVAVLPAAQGPQEGEQADQPQAERHRHQINQHVHGRFPPR